MDFILKKINLIEKENSKKFLMEKYTDIEIELIKYVKNVYTYFGAKSREKCYLIRNLNKFLLYLLLL